MRNKPPEGAAGDRCANHLSDELSPYLLQHAGNPVDWYPWGEEAFDRARSEDRPVFLSIGYSTCHWCHVMEKESFEDNAVAALLNEFFVSIKVDREERPDIDAAYMDAAVLMSGRGGWPLTIIMTPDGEPFFAATYLPRESRFGMPGMLELLPRIAELWRTKRRDLGDTAARVVTALATEEPLAPPGTTPIGGARETTLEEDDLEAATAALAASFDVRYGGFGGAPKFPSPHTLLYLLGRHARTGVDETLSMATRTLKAMRRGGIYDHVGFGFHRYSTDARWLVPHFEKMLYDQALLMMAYTEAWRATRDDLFSRTVREVAEYIERDLTDTEGGIYSAEDADSDGVEGKFYVWRRDELRDILGDSTAIEERFGVSPQGNLTDESTGRASGANILHLMDAFVADGANETGAASAADGSRVADAAPGDDGGWDVARQRLLEARSRRVRPSLDDKILTDWNGLAIAALARAGSVFGDTAMVTAASRAADFILATARDADGRLLHRVRRGSAGLTALADDYAFLTWGLIELYEATFDPSRLRVAIELTDEFIDHFWDRTRGGFYLTPDDGERLLIRQRRVYDGAVPSANATALTNLLRLSHLTGRVDLEERAGDLVRAFGADVRKQPAAYTHFLSGVDMALAPHPTVVVVGDQDRDDTRSMLATARRTLPAGAGLLYAPADRVSHTRRSLEEIAPFVSEMEMVVGRATAYVCRGRSCSRPVTDTDEAARLIRGSGPRSS